MTRLILVLSGFVLIGGPVVFFTWYEVSELLLGRPHPVRLTIAILLLPVLFLVLRRLGRYICTIAEREGVQNS